MQPKLLLKSQLLVTTFLVIMCLSVYSPFDKRSLINYAFVFLTLLYIAVTVGVHVKLHRFLFASFLVQAAFICAIVSLFMYHMYHIFVHDINSPDLPNLLIKAVFNWIIIFMPLFLVFFQYLTYMAAPKDSLIKNQATSIGIKAS